MTLRNETFRKTVNNKTTLYRALTVATAQYIKLLDCIIEINSPHIPFYSLHVSVSI